MSKSLRRIEATLAAAGYPHKIREMPGETRTAADAAREAGCDVDQIAKSIIFRGEETGQTVLFITAGGHQVDAAKASALAGEPIGRADAAFVREMTGFAIGGVAPIAHKVPPKAFFDPRLYDFETVYPAAGTPRHIFEIAPAILRELAQAQDADFVQFRD
ncbi:MAG: YbaK/EbsC family protein [Pseudomonadota bacterium]